MAFIRRVRTASGATGVQIAEYVRGRQRIVEHVGSAHTEAELGVLLARARELLENPAQGVLELDVEPTPPALGLVAPAGDLVLFNIPGTAAPAGRTGPPAWSARTRASCSMRWPASSQPWGLTASAMRCSGIW